MKISGALSRGDDEAAVPSSGYYRRSGTSAPRNLKQRPGVLPGRVIGNCRMALRLSGLSGCTREHAHAFYIAGRYHPEIAGLSGCLTNGGQWRHFIRRWI
ncbi:hypothetical protein KCP70_13830 [Salmonella enterica subsp. enterica]|nr:hypothetical protein KCP70_13830 [Salmonella enterica subsp. enterica]